eukprot:gene3388-13428_t
MSVYTDTLRVPVRNTGTLTRGHFVPPPHKNAAYMDAPIHVHALGFNISAAHMHVTMLEALDVQPGQTFLDAGCGCGVIAAVAAYMVGKTGKVLAVDTKKDCVELSRSNLDLLKEGNEE